MKTLIFDGNHLLFRCLYIGKQNCLDNDWNFIRYLFLNSILSSQKRFKGDEIVIAFDSGTNWRKEIFSEYKANRKGTRDPDINLTSFFEFVNGFAKEELRIFPFKVIKSKYAEGDDIIGALCKELDGEIVIISSDKDFKQLLRLDNVQIYDPIKERLIEVDDPERFLLIQTIMGDKADNVPDINATKIYSDEFKNFAFNLTSGKSLDSLSRKDKLKIEKEFLTCHGIENMAKWKTGRIGEKTAEKIIDGNHKKLKLNDVLESPRFKFNKILIDLTMIPQELTRVICNKYKSQKVTFNEESIIIYLREHLMKEFQKEFHILRTFFEILGK